MSRTFGICVLFSALIFWYPGKAQTREELLARIEALEKRVKQLEEELAALKVAVEVLGETPAQAATPAPARLPPRHPPLHQLPPAPNLTRHCLQLPIPRLQRDC